MSRPGRRTKHLAVAESAGLPVMQLQNPLRMDAGGRHVNYAHAVIRIDDPALSLHV